MELFKHQVSGVEFLAKQPAAMLADEMGLGKSRQALMAALKLFKLKKIDRILVLCPAAVRYSWNEELHKLREDNTWFQIVGYSTSLMTVVTRMIAQVKNPFDIPVICIVSYGLMPQEKHAKALGNWLRGGDGLLICDESSFLANRASATSKNTAKLATGALYRWLLTGTPIANSPLDMYSQGFIMAAGLNGPLKGISNFYHFRASFGTMGGFKGRQWFVDKDKLPKLQARFKPYILRREKRDCFDLPPKTYTVREVILGESTWQIYKELRREALLCLPDTEAIPEPNAAIRIMRLCQITSGHVGIPGAPLDDPTTKDISLEKIEWLIDALENELETQKAIIIWCRWTRERERLKQYLYGRSHLVTQVFGGQSQVQRDTQIKMFQEMDCKRVLLAQPHAGGFGLNLTQAHTAIYMSNDFSYITRVQSEDRCHRIGQRNPVLYIDVLATGPDGQETVDHHIRRTLLAKKDLAGLTCSAWRRILQEE